MEVKTCVVGEVTYTVSILSIERYAVAFLLKWFKLVSSHHASFSCNHSK